MGLFAWLNSKSKTKVDDAIKSAGQLDDTDSTFVEAARISGPFSSGNLSVFLIHNKDTVSLGDVLTLEEALEQKKVTIKETGNVSKLLINNTGEQCVFIQSGDIVMGGRQDRTLQYDMILTPKSGFIPIDSFCVERNRWHQRANEDAGSFSNSHHHLSNKSLRMAAKHSNSQEAVWQAVSDMQRSSASNIGMHMCDLANAISPTSLPLTMENEKLKQATDDYFKDLSAVPEQDSDVLGYAIAINGQVNSIDVYASADLFKKMWPKLLRAAAQEAFSELKTGTQFPEPSPAQVRECMVDAENGMAQEKAVSGQGKTIVKESPRNVLFETRDLTNGGKWVHRNYASK